MRRTSTILAALVLVAAGSSVVTAGPVAAATGCIWLDGVRPQGTTVDVVNWSFTCQPDYAGVPRWYPSVTPQPAPLAPPSPVAAAPAPREDSHYEGYCVGDQYVSSSRRFVPDGNGGSYWTDPAPLSRVQDGYEADAAEMVAAECHDSVLS